MQISTKWIYNAAAAFSHRNSIFHLDISRDWKYHWTTLAIQFRSYHLQVDHILFIDQRNILSSYVSKIFIVAHFPFQSTLDSGQSFFFRIAPEIF